MILRGSLKQKHDVESRFLILAGLLKQSYNRHESFAKAPTAPWLALGNGQKRMSIEVVGVVEVDIRISTEIVALLAVSLVFLHDF